jgi:hypothetical protein
MMQKLLRLDLKIAFLIYIILDTILVGMGMGVPFFCILFGFPVGWYLTRRLTTSPNGLDNILRQILVYASFSSLVTFFLMLIIWGGFFSVFYNPNFDYANFGIPMILYDPKISFIGWLILMIFISPFLQLLTTIFASFLTLVRWSKSI